MTERRKIEVSLLIIRLSAAIFLGLWATLKFWRPEWTQNIFRGAYNIGFVEITPAIAYSLGVLQLAIVLAFAIGFQRFWTYGLMMLMSAAGVLGSLDAFGSYWNYPKNLMLTSIPTLGALTALFILRDLDNLWSVSARKSRQR